jgi:hypothetical protein
MSVLSPQAYPTLSTQPAPHPSAALPGDFLSIENRRILDQALTAVNRETLARCGINDERGNVVGITHYADNCPESQNISPEMELQMRQDVFKRVGGYVGPAVWELGRSLTKKEKQEELIWLKRGSYVKRLGNEMQKRYKTPFAEMSFVDLRAIRGEATLGVPRTGGTASTTMILYDRAIDHYYYSLTDNPMVKKLVELKVFNTARTAKDNMKRLKEYAREGMFKLVPAIRGGGQKKSGRGAGGRDMPPHLDLWLSVDKVPKGENVTKLTN